MSCRRLPCTFPIRLAHVPAHGQHGQCQVLCLTLLGGSRGRALGTLCKKPLLGDRQGPDLTCTRYSPRTPSSPTGSVVVNALHRGTIADPSWRILLSLFCAQRRVHTLTRAAVARLPTALSTVAAVRLVAQEPQAVPDGAGVQEAVPCGFVSVPPWGSHGRATYRRASERGFPCLPPGTVAASTCAFSFWSCCPLKSVQQSVTVCHPWVTWLT